MRWTRRSRSSATPRRPSGWPPARSRGGVLHYSRVLRQTATYRVHGPAKEPRQLIIVQRRLPGWTLVKPDAKGMELSEGNYRIPFQLPGGDQTQVVEVVQEQTQQQELRLLDAAADQIRVFAQATRVRRQDARGADQGPAAAAGGGRCPAQGRAGRRRAAADRPGAGAAARQSRARAGQQRPAAALSRHPRQAGDRARGLAKRRADAEKAVETARDALRSYVAQLG